MLSSWLSWAPGCMSCQFPFHSHTALPELALHCWSEAERRLVNQLICSLTVFRLNFLIWGKLHPLSLSLPDSHRFSHTYPSVTQFCFPSSLPYGYICPSPTHLTHWIYFPSSNYSIIPPSGSTFLAFQILQPFVVSTYWCAAFVSTSTPLPHLTINHPPPLTNLYQLSPLSILLHHDTKCKITRVDGHCLSCWPSSMFSLLQYKYLPSLMTLHLILMFLSLPRKRFFFVPIIILIWIVVFYN